MQLLSLNYAFIILCVSCNGYCPRAVNFISKKWSMTSTVHGKNKMCDSCFVWSLWIGICSAVEQELLQESSSVVQAVYKISCNSSGRMGSSTFWKLSNSLYFTKFRNNGLAEQKQHFLNLSYSTWMYTGEFEIVNFLFEDIIVRLSLIINACITQVFHRWQWIPSTRQTKRFKKKEKEVYWKIISVNIITFESLK